MGAVRNAWLMLAVAAATVAVAAPAASAAVEAVGCGAVVSHDITLHADLVGCPGDGLVVGASGVRINLNGFSISGSKAPGSVGIRNLGYDGVRVDGGGPFATVQEFETGLLITGAKRVTVNGLLTRSVTFGIRLERSDRATLRGNDVGFVEFETDCVPIAPTGILMVDSDHATIRDNKTQLTGYGIMLIRSHDNLIKGNGAAPETSDGNFCSGIVLLASNANRVVGNVAAQNRGGHPDVGDGIFVDARSKGTVLRGNSAATNIDDGIDVENATTKVFDNHADTNDDYGIESVAGVTAGGNTASGNGNPAQCLNVSCA